MSDHNPDSAPIQLSFDDIEEWRDVPGYEGLYRVSNKGRVWSVRSNRLMKPSFKHGYHVLSINVNGVRTHNSVHSFVALAFIGPRPTEYVIDHINHIRNDNRVENLRYITGAENNANSTRFGELSNFSRLSNRQTCEIKRLWATGAYSTKKQLADELNLPRKTVSDIIRGRRCAKVDCGQYSTK